MNCFVLIEISQNYILVRFYWSSAWFCSKIPEQDAVVVGEAYLNLLGCCKWSKILSDIFDAWYYFLSCGLLFNPSDIRALDKRILILNLGAQLFCRTIAKVRNEHLSNYINFEDWQHFPKAVKFVLRLEYKDFSILEKVAQLPIYDFAWTVVKRRCRKWIFQWIMFNKGYSNLVGHCIMI